MAAITSYGTLKTAVADYLARSDLTTFVPNFVQNAELKFYRSMRLRFMEKALTGTISAGVVAVPADYLEMKSLRIVSSGRSYPVQRTTLENLYEQYPLRTATGLPTHFAREGTNFVFGPYPDSAYSVEGIYYATQTYLFSGVDGASNWLITNAADVLLYGSLLEAEPFIKNDARLALWRDMLSMAITTVKDQEAGEDLSGSAVTEVVA